MGLCRWRGVGLKIILLIGLATMGCGPAFAADEAPAGTTKTAVLASHGASKYRLTFNRDMDIECSFIVDVGSNSLRILQANS